VADTYFADISEWQSSFDVNAYLNAGQRILIVRAHSGYRVDKYFATRRQQVTGKPFDAVGYYQYLASDRSATDQANEFVSAVGKLAANEFAVVDIEEGSNQTSRGESWFSIVDPWAGALAVLYASSSFFQSNLSGCAHWGKRPLWIAAYLNSYSPTPGKDPAGCTWWQYTDRATFAGLPGSVDGNVFRGTSKEFAGKVLPTVAPPKPAPTQPDESMVQLVGNDGRQIVFVETNDGTVKMRDQGSPNAGTWKDWKSLGKPG
jgi:GH25 family lysozyme M1 (1,4-beta-N-acetylmuramidase)